MVRFPRGQDGPAWRTWALAIAAIVSVATAVALVTLTRRTPSPHAPGEAASTEALPGSDRLYLSGLDYSAYDGADPVFRLQARKLIHRKRKLGPLTINPVKEVELRGVRIDLLPPRSSGVAPAEAAHSGPSLDLLLKGMLSSKNLGFVSRVILRDLEIEDRRGGDTSHLTADEVIFRPGEDHLEVRGRFEIRDRDGRRSGRDASLSLGQGTTWKMTVDSPR